MSEQVAFRSLYPRWNNPIERNRLLADVASGHYDTKYVENLLSKKHFEYLPNAVNLKKISSEEILIIREKIISLLRECSGDQLDLKGQDNLDHSNFNWRLFSEVLTIIPLNLYEASKESIWNYLTWYALLDVAVFLYPPGSEKQMHQRYDFNRSRHVIARWWWRAEISSHDPLKENLVLTEKDWELIFERQNLIWNPDVVNALVEVIRHFKDSGKFDPKMYPEDFERRWIKRILRMTSQSRFETYTRVELYERFLKELHALRI